jgi:ketosteroid isomerase-like protein
MRNIVLLAALIIAFAQSSSQPQTVVDELLAADRAFSVAGAKENVVDALSAMFGDEVVMPLPTGEFARNKPKAIEALGANPDNLKGRVEWAPIRAGISGDGQHGFTVGYMTLHRADNAPVPIKYVAYWVKQPVGWRVAVYKRARGAERSAPTDLMAPALPPRLVTQSTDTATLARYKASLDLAERAFSDDAQKIGIGPAFVKHGSADAMNVGGPTDPGFVVGAEAIGRAIGGGAPASGSTVSWAPDGVIVAPSGDLGVTFGMIRRNTPPPGGQPSAVPYITIWRRATPNDAWRYVAE